MDLDAVSHGLQRVRLVVLLIEDHASQRLVDPVGPLVEAFMDRFALIKEFVSVDCHDAFLAWVAQDKRKDGHFKKFSLWLLALGLGSRFAYRRHDH